MPQMHGRCLSTKSCLCLSKVRCFSFPKALTYISDTHNHRLLLIPILNCICFVLIPCTAQLFRRFTMWVTQCQIYGYTQHSVTHIPNSGVNCTHPTPLKWFPAIAFEELAGATVIETEMLRTVASSGLWHHNTKLRTTISAPLLHTLHIGDCTLETLHIAHCTLEIAHCTLHIAHCTTLHVAH